MTTATIDNPELEQETAALITSTAQLIVTDAASYTLAGERLTGLATLKRKIETWFEPLVEAAHKAHKALTTRRATSLKPIDAEIDRLKRQMGAWKAEQDRLQREREREAALAAQRAEQARLEAEAALLERQGEPALAAAVIEQAIATPAPAVVLPSAVPTIAGVSTAEAYDYVIVNEDLLPRAYLTPDHKKIRGVVQAMKLATRIPGVQVKRVDQMRVRSA